MDKYTMTMTEFMKVHGPYLGWPPDKIVTMAEQEMREGKDFTFIIRNAFYTVPLISLQEYFGVPVDLDKTPVPATPIIVDVPPAKTPKLPKI